MEPQSIEAMYPRVPVELLLREEWQARFRQYFLTSGELAADPFEFATRTERPQRRCVSVCLFKQAVDNRVPNEFPVNDNYWRVKYWDQLLAIVRELPRLPEWKLRVCVENQLWDLAESAIGAHEQVELYRMRVDSVGACPGMLWRFLALADQSLEMVLSTDVDEPLMAKVDYIHSFEMDCWSSIARIGGFASGRQYLVDPLRSRVKNYATILGSRIMSRPARWDFDIASAMRGFMAHRRYMSQTDRPWAYTDQEEPTVYNEPIGGHVYGWGSHWYMYGFDERFLKHALYYHFAERGQIHTWTTSLSPRQMDPEGVRDLQHVRARGNTTVCPHTIIRLESLRLRGDALRIAFILDECRWIFEELLRLMTRHGETGFCGNVYFHTMSDPYFAGLVSKQVNLFNVARFASKVLEIGFNAGHSAAIMLLANPHLTVRAFDTCDLAYTKPCLEFLNSVFRNRIMLVEGPSQVTVPADGGSGYDLAHIDADHTYDAVVGDLTNALSKCVPGAIVVMDDHETGNDIARATLERTELVPTNSYTLHEVIPGSSHAIFHYTPLQPLISPSSHSG